MPCPETQGREEGGRRVRCDAIWRVTGVTDHAGRGAPGTCGTVRGFATSLELISCGIPAGFHPAMDVELPSDSACPQVRGQLPRSRC